MFDACLWSWGFFFWETPTCRVATWVEGETLGCRHDSVIQAERAHGPGWHTRGDWMTGGKGGKEKKKKPGKRVGDER